MPTIETRKSLKTGKTAYRVKIRKYGQKSKSSTFKTKLAAESWAKRIEVEMETDKYFPDDKARRTQFKELASLYLNDLVLTNPRRAREVRFMLNWWCHHLGHLPLNQITPQHVLNARSQLANRKTKRLANAGLLTHSTVNRYTVVLTTCLNYAVKTLRWIPLSPMAGIKQLLEPAGRVRYLSDKEKVSLLEQVRKSPNPYLYAVVLIGISTGARRSEIRHLRLGDLAPDFSSATLHKTKNKAIKVLPFTGIVGQAVRDLVLSHGTDDNKRCLFPSPTDPYKARDFESAWKTARCKAGVLDFRFHDLRHTCASYLAMNNATPIEIADVLGHKTLQMAMRYSHLSIAHKTDVVARMTQQTLGEQLTAKEVANVDA